MVVTASPTARPHACAASCTWTLSCPKTEKACSTTSTRIAAQIINQGQIGGFVDPLPLQISG